MRAERRNTLNNNDTSERLLAPPGFASLSTFSLKKVKHNEENLCCKKGLKDASAQEKLQDDTKFDKVDAKKIKESVGSRPWILYDNVDPIAKYDHPLQPDKVTEMQYPGDARGDDLEEVPVFLPSEELVKCSNIQGARILSQEFNDTLKYIESIRLEAEPYGMCRIIPPPSWQPPCLILEKSIWEHSTFVTQFQQVGKFPTQYAKSKIAEGTRNRRRGTSFQQGVSCENSLNSDEVACLEDSNVLKPGPEFTLKAFKKHADDFLQDHFFSKHMHCKLAQPSLESIKHKYRQIVENPTEVTEVLYGDNLDAITFGSGFPTASNSQGLYPSYVCSSWNLNNVPKLPGSLLSFENDKTSGVLVPRLRIGMCFSSLDWKVEEHHLYLLCYMHVGSQKIWRCIPGRYSSKYEALMKKYQPDLLANQSKLHQGAITGHDIPVYCCIQHPREFVLVFPGAYYSALDCGFNVVEAVNFAPLDWLPHGLNAVALYQAQGRKTSISFDKLLIGAAREAVKAQRELSFLRNTSDNLRWKIACGKNKILAETLKSRVKQEGNRREYLCSTSGKKKDKNFNATGKKECSICYFDLYLSAAYCPCAANKYSCLNHAMRLCSSCPWTEKIFLYQYEISELNSLVEALEGKLTAVYRWAREDCNLGLPDYIQQEKICTKDKGQKERTFQDAGTSYGNGWSAASSIRAEVKAHLQQSQYSNKQSSIDKTISTPSLPSVTLEDTYSLVGGMIPESLTSSSSDSDDAADLDLDDGGEVCILSTSSSRPPGHPERKETSPVLWRPREREVKLSELKKSPERKLSSSNRTQDIFHNHSKSSSKKLHTEHAASKKRKKR